MKTKWIALPLAITCLGLTAPAFAQNKPETTQDKILRLEVENQLLNDRVQRLEKELIDLKAKQQTATTTDKPSWPVAGVPAAPKAVAATKQAKKRPIIFATDKIQRDVMSFRAAASWAAKMYRINPTFRIIDTRVEESDVLVFFIRSHEGNNLYVTYTVNGETATKSFYQKKSNIVTGIGL